LILKENEFRSKIGNGKKTDALFENLVYVQTCIRSKSGIGEPITVTFYAPMNLQNIEDEIRYDYNSLGEDVELLKASEELFCLKQCYKMAYYMSKLHKIELIKFRAEFFKDENETIWFSYASQIVARPIKGNVEENSKRKQNTFINKEH